MTVKKESKPYHVTLTKQGIQFHALPNQSILQAALDANVVFPVSCRNGSCRTCRCKVLSGSIHYDIAWPSLSSEEKNNGWILPCIAKCDSDLELDMIFAQYATKNHSE
jgi:ferredoxin